MNCVGTYLAADGEEGVAGGVHEEEVGLGGGHVVVDAVDEVAGGIEDGEAVAVE